MKRWDLIQYLIDKYNYQSYLEIGTRKNETFSKIKVKKKVGVDPFSGGTHRMTSDAFFHINNKYFDIIFIDGDHTHQQVTKDILNSLDCLNEGGTIVCHDMNPQEEINQAVPQKIRKWNGDVWKAWADFRIQRSDLSMHVIDTDHGLGVIQKGSQETINYPENIEWKWEHLENDRQNILNLISVEEFYSLYER